MSAESIRSSTGGVSKPESHKAPTDAPQTDTNVGDDATKENPDSLDKSEPQVPSNPPPPKGPPLPPGPLDGGLICWLQVVGSFCLWANSWGLVNAYGQFQTYYEQTLPGISPSQISWIGSIQGFLVLALGIVVGPLYDAGYFRHLIVVGNFMVVFGLMMTSIAKEYWQFVLAQGIVCGLGFGMLFTPGVAILPQYFVKKRAWANGIAATGSGVGGVIYPIVLYKLVPQIGFGWTVRVMGFISLLFGIVAIATTRNKLPPKPMRSFFDLDFFKNTPLVIYAISTIFTFMATYIPVFYIGGYSLHYHITNPELAFYLVPILQAANILGRLLPNFYADKVGPMNMTLPALAISAILTFGWIGIKNQGGLIAYAVLYGVVFGVLLSTPPANMMQLVTEFRTIGSKMGTGFFIASMGVLVGSPISGAILKSTGDYLGVQAFTASLLAVGTVVLIAARVSKVGWAIVKI